MKIIPLFIGDKNGDQRGDNVFMPIGEIDFLPPKPKQSDYGHLSYENSKHVQWVNNMQALIERHNISQINGFPSTVDQIEKAKNEYFKVREYYLSLEKNLLLDIKSDE